MAFVIVTADVRNIDHLGYLTSLLHRQTVAPRPGPCQKTNEWQQDDQSSGIWARPRIAVLTKVGQFNSRLV
jgi:hypothetical protein